MSCLLDQLSASLDASSLILGNDISEKYSFDWSGSKPCLPRALLKPKTTSELFLIMALCYEHDQPVIAITALVYSVQENNTLTQKFDCLKIDWNTS